MEKFKVVAPTRADLAGGTLDLWPLYCLLGEGKTVNIALSLMAEAHFEIYPARGFSLEVMLSDGKSILMDGPSSRVEIEALPGDFRLPAMVVSEFLRQKASGREGQIKIRLKSQVPVGSGLGGSSALCVALTRGLGRVFGDYQEQGWQWALLDWVRDIEACHLRLPTGTQDYLAALFGGLRCYTSHVGGILEAPYAEGIFESMSERLFICYSGQRHQSGLSNWEVFKSALQGDRKVLEGLEGIKLVAEQLDGELRSGNLSWKHIGQHLTEEWQIRKKLFNIETDRLEEMLEFLQSKGVFGAKVCGAASGGSILALVEPSQKQELTRLCKDFGIDVISAQCSAKGVRIV
jgi:D-glycero-alpha-D-manno-heptose-7-phosphate kinase